MDEHQRRVWLRMIESLDAFDAERIDLEILCSKLKGLLGASDLHDESLIAEFWNHFAPIDVELEVRTEPWAPAGAASEDELQAALASYRTWVTDVLAEPSQRRR